MIRIAVNGAAGRMGQRILALAKESGEFEVAGAFDRAPGPGITPIGSAALTGKGALVDFSSPEGTLLAAQAAAKSGWGLVVGTTGLTDKEHDSLKKVSSKIPVVVSSNMSIGVNTVMALLEIASKKLPKNFSVEMSEAHHIHKKDSPSGTASSLAIQIAEYRGLDLKTLLKDIKVTREGEIIGDHSVIFKSPDEVIEVRHHARSRDIFARGALTAAKFVSQKGAGFYSMRDVLGL